MLPLTELNNTSTADIDTLDTIDVLRKINDEDQRVAVAMQTQLAPIARAVDGIVERMLRGGRLIYIGAGTSGRLGVLDASEMPPTFGLPHGVVVGIIAGGDRALRLPIEGAEDDAEQGRRDVIAIDLNATDSLIGLAASGRTPYVIGALDYARGAGALTVSIACSKPAPVHAAAEINIAPIVGPEVISGSTRMKSGTAQKLALNMISTGVMIKLGKTYGNLMVDVTASNIKLRDRALRIVAEACCLTPADAGTLLERSGGEVKTAIVMQLKNLSAVDARAALRNNHGRVRKALES